MKYLKFTFFFFALLACKEYDPQGDYNVEIRKPTNPPTTIINIDKVSGAIDLCFRQEFDFLATRYTDLYLIEILFNGNIIYTTNSNYGRFELDPTYLSNGTYTLEFKVYTKTATGSLADKLGAEAYVTSKKVDVLVDRNLYPVEITGIAPGMGSLMITWEKYTRPDFKKYELYSIRKGISTPIRVIYDQNTISSDDGHYVGGTCDYFVKTYTLTDSKVSETKRFVDTYPKLVSITDNIYGQKVAKFTKCKYVMGFSSYEIYKDIISTSNKIAGSYSMSDTSLTLYYLLFGKQHDIILKTSSETSTMKTHLGNRSKQFSKAISTESLDNIFLMKDNYAYRYSVTDNKAIDSVEISNASTNLFAVSLNYKYLSFGNSSELLLLNPLDFNQKTTFTANDIFGDNSDYFTMVSISNNGIATICGTKSFAIYDLINSNLILKQNLVKSFVKISPNGKYIVDIGNSSVLYEFNGTALVEIKQWTEKLNYVDFNPQNPNELIYFQSSEKLIKKMDCVSLSTINSSNASPMYPIAIDPITGLVFYDSQYEGYGGKFYNITRIGSMYTLYSILATDINNYLFHNSTIYSSIGYSLKVPVSAK